MEKTILLVVVSLGGALFGAIVCGVGAGYLVAMIIEKGTRNDTSGVAGFAIFAYGVVAAFIGAIVGLIAGGRTAFVLHRSDNVQWLGYVVSLGGFLLTALLAWWLTVGHVAYNRRAHPNYRLSARP